MDEERRAADFKPPWAKKRRSIGQDTTERIRILPYALALMNCHETFEEMTPQEQPERLVQLVINLEAGVDQLGAFYVTMNKEVENTANAQWLSNQMLNRNI
jgi:hypothetical protein